MSTADLPTLLLGMALAFWLGANNVSAIIGHSMGARPIERRRLLLIFAAGVAAGLILEGWRLRGSISGQLIQPPVAPHFSGSVLVTTAAVLSLGSLFGYPLSMVQSIIGGSVGAALGLGYEINAFALLGYSAAWVLTPLLSAGLVFISYSLLRRAAKARKNLVATNKALANASYAVIGYASYALGVSALALLSSLLPGDLSLGPAMVAGAAILGAYLASGRVLRSFSYMLAGLTPMQAVASQVSASAVVHFFTGLALPVSIVHASLGWVLAAPFTHAASIVNWRLLIRIVYQWAVTPFVSAAVALLIVLLARPLF